MRFHKTQYDDGEQRLLYAKVGTHWRFFHQVKSQESWPVGPMYPSKETLLASMATYAAVFGFNELKQETI